MISRGKSLIKLGIFDSLNRTCNAVEDFELGGDVVCSPLVSVFLFGIASFSGVNLWVPTTLDCRVLPGLRYAIAKGIGRNKWYALQLRECVRMALHLLCEACARRVPCKLLHFLHCGYNLCMRVLLVEWLLPLCILVGGWWSAWNCFTLRIPHEWQPWLLPNSRIVCRCLSVACVDRTGIHSLANAPGFNKWLGRTEEKRPPSALNRIALPRVDVINSRTPNSTSLPSVRGSVLGGTVCQWCERESTLTAVTDAMQPAVRTDAQPHIEAMGLPCVIKSGLNTANWPSPRTAGNAIAPATDVASKSLFVSDVSVGIDADILEKKALIRIVTAYVSGSTTQM